MTSKLSFLSHEILRSGKMYIQSCGDIRLAVVITKKITFHKTYPKRYILQDYMGRLKSISLSKIDAQPALHQ